MPIFSRGSTPLPRSYLYDERLAKLSDPLAREGYFRLKLGTDNLGRMPGNPALLAGLLFPLSPPKSLIMERIVREWVEADLVFWWERGPFRVIEVCDHGLTQRLVGNMSAKSDHPPVPSHLIEAWEQRTGLCWRSIIETDSDNERTNAVYTRTNASEPDSTNASEPKSINSFDRRGLGLDGVGVDGPPKGSQANAKHLPLLDVEKELIAITGGHFDLKQELTGYEYTHRFIEVVKSLYKQFMSGGYRSLEAAETQLHAMQNIEDACRQCGFDAPESWTVLIRRLAMQLKD